MAARNRNLPPSLRNPFEQTGLDKGIIEALTATGDDSLEIALNGLRRSIARALHPDITGTIPENAAEYLDDFLQATSRLMGMDPADRKKFAQSYTRGRRPSVKEKPVEYESIDLHNGELLKSMVDMVVDSGESIPSARNKKIMLRPIDFSANKPSDFKGESNEWYPPESAQMTLLEVDGQGEVTYQKLLQVSFTNLLRKEHRMQNVEALYQKQVRDLSSGMWLDLESVVADIDTQAFAKGHDTLIVDKKDGELNVFQGSSGAYVGSAKESSAAVAHASDGVYTFGFFTTSQPKEGVLHDAHYIYSSNDGAQDATDLKVLGTCDSSYIDLQRSQIYDRPQDRYIDRQLELPPTNRSGDISLFAVPSVMYRHVQKVYTPQLITEGDKQRYVLATDDNRTLYILGKLESLTNRNGGRDSRG